MADEMPSLEAAAEMAGVLAAHAVWSVSDGATLIPIYGFADQEKAHHMERLVADQIEDAVKTGEENLAQNPHDALHGTLIYDGRITLPNARLDALVVQFREFTRPEEDKVVIAIPYTPAADGRPFAVHKPKVLQLPDTDNDALFSAFFRGVAKHSKGAQIWNEHLDESI